MTLTPRQRAAAVVAAALVGVGAAWLVAPRGAPVASGDLPRVASSSTPSAGGRPASPTPEGRITARPATLSGEGLSAEGRSAGAGAPTRVSLPAIGLSLPVRPLGVDDEGLMALPETAYAAAWYRFGPDPLDRRGATVIAGHVDTPAEGVGPLSRLASARPGQELVVSVGARQVRYRVSDVRRVAKSVLDLPELFARSGPPRLHLVTCGGAYLPDRGGYQDNVVVTARPMGR